MAAATATEEKLFTPAYQQRGNDIDLNFTAMQPKQEDFFVDYTDGREIIYGLGGSRGGSKSWIIRNLQLVRRIKYERTAGCILMRVYDDLLDNHIRPMLAENPQLQAKFNKNEKIITFENGSYIRFISAEHYGDVFKLYGKEFADVMVDQSERFQQEELEFLKTVNRCTTNLEIVPKMCWSFNPGGASHAFHKRLFIQKEFINNEKGEEYYFMKLSGWDNVRWVLRYLLSQGLSQDDYYALYTDEERFKLFVTHSDYGRNLFGLDDSKRKAQLYGDFDTFEGQFFEMWRDAYHRIPRGFPSVDAGTFTMKPPEGWKMLGGLDYGNRTALEVLTRDYEGNVICFLEAFSEDMTPKDRFNKMADKLIEYELWRLPIECDTNMSVSLKHYYGIDNTPLEMAEEVFKERMGDNRPSLHIVAKVATEKYNYRIACNEAIKEFLSWKIDEKGELVKRPKIKVMESCPMLMKSITELVHNPGSRDGLDFSDKIGMDDPFDAFKMAFMLLYAPRQAVKEEITSYDDYMDKRVFKPMMQKINQPKIRPGSL